MWTQLAEFLEANGRETLIISVVGTLLVWMYKQIKGMIDREEQEKQTTIQLKQALFTKLELNLASVLHLGDEESKRRLLELLGECGPYLTRMQRTMVRDWKMGDVLDLHSHSSCSDCISVVQQASAGNNPSIVLQSDLRARTDRGVGRRA
jgi:hypothetical protein